MSLNSTMKRAGRAAEFLAWTVFFTGAAMVLALRFWLLPDIERHRESIVAAAARAVGQPIRIGAIQARWDGLRPRIDLTDVRLYDREGREALVLPTVRNTLSWRGLARGEVRLRSMVIDGLRLQARRDPSGALFIAGVKLGGDGGGFADWALAQEEIVLRNAEIDWHDEQRGAPPLRLAAVNLKLRNSGSEHAIGLNAQPPAELGGLLELRGVLRARDARELRAPSGRLYAELGYTDLAAWRPWIDYPWRVDRGEGALRAWLAVEQGKATRATLDLALSGVAASLGDALAPLQLAALRGRFEADLSGGGYQLAGRGVEWQTDEGPAIAPGPFDVRWKPGAGGAIAAERIDLQPLAQLAAALPLPEQARRVLAQAQPRGRLAGTKVEWSGPADAPGRLVASGSFSELATEPWGRLPGFSGLSGSFDTTEARGRVQLDSRKSALDLPHVFPESTLVLDTLSGQVEWERQGAEGFVVRLLSLSLANAHLSGNAYGTYVHSAGGPGAADLSAQFNRADARHLARYLPHGAMMGGAKVREWLARAIVAGQSSDVRVRLRGELADFPFADPLRGEFSVIAQVDNGVLDYAPGWPRIEAIEGELRFQRDAMEFLGRSGRLSGVALADVRAAIPRLAEGQARLHVSGQAQGATADFLGFVEASPLRAKVGGLTDSLKAGGRGRLRLQVDLPLKDPGGSQVAGEYELLDNNLVVHAELPAIEQVAGKVSFTQSGFALQGVRGSLFGGPLMIGGGTRADGTVEVAAKGQATAEGLRPFFDHPLSAQLSGSMPYAATVTVANGRSRFRLETSLRDVGSTLPAPFAKAPGEEMSLRLETAPLQNGARDRISLTLGRVLRAEALREREGEGMKLQRAVVALFPAADRAPRLPQQPGVLVSGSLSSLDADRWQALLQGGGSMPAVSVDLRIGELDVYGKRLREVVLRGSGEATGWSGALVSRDLAGDISYRAANGGKLVARLTHFRMPDEYPGAKPRAPLAPKDLPAVDLAAERFDYRGKQLGRVELAAQRAGEDWRIEKLAIANADATFSGNGLWRNGSPSHSSLEFQLQAANAGELLNRLGYRDLVKGGRAQLQGSLSWVGEPAVIDYPTLAGQVKLEAHEGQFLEIEPGLGKLVSLMSLQSLPRRITFDFRDVFSKGFEFDHISSSGQIAGGVMAVEDFRMRGSSADVSMSGKVDLARETQDLRVRVIPSLGDSAATVIALVVNPLLAIPAAIAQKILKDPLGQIFAFNYAVTGGWAEPNVERLGVETQAVETQ